MTGDPSRRDVLATLAAAAAVPLGGVPRQEQPAVPAQHAIVPLPFKPGSLNGISEKLIVSHHENNYAGAVKNLNRVEVELARATRETPPFLVAALRDRELVYRNSATFHELYFANLGAGESPSATLKEAVGRSFGTFGRFEEGFRAAGAALGGGSGWVVLSHDLHRGALAISGSGGHKESAAACVPLLVMDLYEHAYAMDFGAAATKYVEAFFANIRWTEVDRRLERAARASAALRG